MPTRLTQWVPGRLVRDCADADLLVLPYNPFMWGGAASRRHSFGTSPRCVAAAAAPSWCSLMHELYLPITDARSLVMGAWQRAQLGALLALADRRFASIESWAARLSRLLPTGHLPSGSNLPDARAQRSPVRDELGMDGLFAVGTLSTGHPSHLISHVEEVLLAPQLKGRPHYLPAAWCGSPRCQRAVRRTSRAPRSGVCRAPRRFGRSVRPLPDAVRGRRLDAPR